MNKACKECSNYQYYKDVCADCEHNNYGWISVDDSTVFPKDNEQVWVYDPSINLDEHFYIHTAIAFNWEGHRGFEGCRPTHWMKIDKPLPPAPEDK